MREIEKEEHALWRLLCQQLEILKAVKRSDLESPVSIMETRGQRLLGLIRRWGQARAELMMANSQPRNPEDS